MSRRATMAPLGSRWAIPVVPEHRPERSYWGSTPATRALVYSHGVVVHGYGKRGTVLLRTSLGGIPLPPMPLDHFVRDATPMGPYGGTRPSGNGVPPKVRRRRLRLTRGGRRAV